MFSWDTVIACWLAIMAYELCRQLRRLLRGKPLTYTVVAIDPASHTVTLEGNPYLDLGTVLEVHQR